MSKALLAHPRIMSVLDLLERFKKNRPETVVFTNGCFDILHPGHVDLLSRAKDMGDYLVVAVNSDESVRNLNKGSDRPVNTLAARMFVLAHLRSVDAVVPFGEDTPLEMIKALQPDVLVKGGDWPVDSIVGSDVVRARKGRVFSLPLMENHSTSELLNRIRGANGR